MIPAFNIIPKRDINGPEARKYSIRDTLFVSPSGKDGYLGASPNLPAKSLFKVKNEIQKLKSGSSKDIKIEFLPGKYEASNFFFKDNKFVYFRHDENGTSDYKLFFKSYDKDNRAVFDNSKTYTGFISAGNLWKVKIDGEDKRKCNLIGYVNDVRSVPARWPKYGSLAEYNTNTHDGLTYVRALDSSTGFLSAVYDYHQQGGSLNRLGYMATTGFLTFVNSSFLFQNILSTLPNTTYTPGIFYLYILGAGNGINIYANTADIQSDEEPSNLDPYIVCTEKAENTIIKEGDDYWFYYKPSNKDLSIGIENSVLKTVKYANPKYWLRDGNNRVHEFDGMDESVYFRGVYKNVLKRNDGYIYFEGDTPENASCIGFNITTPKNISFENLDMNFCVNPITLYTPSSAYRVATNTLLDTIEEFSDNISISGCRIMNTYSSTIHVVRVNNAKIYKNLIYGSEAGGIKYINGFNIKIENNIIKSTNTIDTRHNGDNGHGFCGLRIYGEFTGSASPNGLSGVSINNNDVSYAGNIMRASDCKTISAFNNKIYNAGFGGNADMACFYTRGTFGLQDWQRNKIYNNVIYNARANSNTSFLGNIIYLDGETQGPYIYNNILFNGQTGIQHTSTDSPHVYNNIVYKTRVDAITNKGNSGSYPLNTKFYRNLFIPAQASDGNPSIIYLGWNVNSVQYRTISTSPYFAEMYNSSGQLTHQPNNPTGSFARLRPIAPWKGKIRYSATSIGGQGTIRTPMLVFDGENWILGEYNTGNNFPDGVNPRLSAINSGSYDNPWDIPPENWIQLGGTTDTTFTTMSGIRRSATRRANTTFPAVSSDRNLLWSTMPMTDNPENNTNFFRYTNWGTIIPQGLWGSNSFQNISSFSAIPDTQYKLNDNSVPSVFGEIQLPEQNSVFGDPLFIDPDNFNFALQPNSPAYSIGFEDIDTSNVGVYNTIDDPFWTLSAINLPGQPVINGHKDWSDYQTIPYPYNPLVEYVAPQVD
jgi:hypothetical protein